MLQARWRAGAARWWHQVSRIKSRRTRSIIAPPPAAIFCCRSAAPRLKRVCALTFCGCACRMWVGASTRNRGGKLAASSPVRLRHDQTNARVRDGRVGRRDGQYRQQKCRQGLRISGTPAQYQLAAK